MIYFSDLGLKDLTCTGLTYDSEHGSFWIADFGCSREEYTRGILPAPQIIELSGDLTGVLNTVPIEGLGQHPNLQGIAYDPVLSCIWLASGDSVYSFDRSGRALSSFDLGEYSSCSANGLAYDERSDTLWVLCYNDYLINLDKSGNILKVLPASYHAQDHICFAPGDNDTIFLTAGDDYNGRKNYLLTLSVSDGGLIDRYVLEQSYAVEGVCINGQKLYVANDGLYHSAKIRRSYIALYDLSLLTA